MKNNKTNQPLKGDGEWQQHRNKYESRKYWGIERKAAKQDIEERLHDTKPQDNLDPKIR